jgi:hypothetical protein
LEEPVASNFTAEKQDNHKINSTDIGKGRKKMELNWVTGRW